MKSPSAKATAPCGPQHAAFRSSLRERANSHDPQTFRSSSRAKHVGGLKTARPIIRPMTTRLFFNALPLHAAWRRREGDPFGDASSLGGFWCSETALNQTPSAVPTRPSIKTNCRRSGLAFLYGRLVVGNDQKICLPSFCRTSRSSTTHSAHRPGHWLPPTTTTAANHLQVTCASLLRPFQLSRP